ncbi:anti-sigma factor [Pedobacter metabolipauper]|uniref:Anti-sigma-K factor rskA n=1 Tax=Pedobacter metabolipauper TaxID=425513 RepID=A0A4R6STC3_9SPHI|nr:anti-sigma factor [Pedobacter metabolipauper]TDQ07665.1 anti-sigma-K factor rskA [Pedobacter metabolipauper]
MEEPRNYIESGILEQYVLDQLSDQEKVKVEEMAEKFPEIKQEIADIEFFLEKYATHHAVSPSNNLEDKILVKLREANITTSHLPKKEAHIVKLNPNEDQSKIRNLRIMLAASIALLIPACIALYSAHNELGLAKDQIASLSLDKEKFTSTVSQITKDNSYLNQLLEMKQDPNWKTVNLASTKSDAQSKMTVYWHTTGKQVMMDNSKMSLPANDSTHQYQLWALVNGKPVDLGVFDVKPDTTQILIAMKDISSANAFAVSLEKRGGNVTPTGDQILLMGGV